VFGHFADRLGNLQAVIEPRANFGEAVYDAHGGFSPESCAIGDPGVGSSPA
jgi:hypothetical protein